MTYQLYIKNANIIDGTGAAPFAGDVAVKDGKLTVFPKVDNGASVALSFTAETAAKACEAAETAAKAGDALENATEVIDAKGLTLAPGFIDAHCHEDETLGNDASTLSKLSQGITTCCCGQCGESYFPVPTDPEHLAILRQSKKEYLTSPDCAYADCFDEFTSFENYRNYLAKRPTAYNYTILAGHGTLRTSVMGMENRKPTVEELTRMKDLLREAMEHGAWGLSTGLMYAPGTYADEEEVTELCKVAGEYGGYYAVHLRNEGGQFEESVEEAIRTAKNSGCILDLSHHKSCGRENWGKTKKTLQMIKDANAAGMQVFTDVYPYLATGNYINISLPREFFANGQAKMQELLRDPAVRAEMKQKITGWKESRYNNCGGFSGIVVCSAPKTPAAVGKSIADYAKSIGKDEFETYFDLCADNGPEGQAAYFAMSEEDLERILLDENSVICTDSYSIGPENAVHPRSFGAFPKVLGEYVREKKLMPLEKMISKMTGKPAGLLQIPKKGYIKDGFDADLVLFDPQTVAAKSDFVDSRALADGIEQVIVAGETVYKDKKLTGRKPGKFIPFQGR